MPEDEKTPANNNIFPLIKKALNMQSAKLSQEILLNDLALVPKIMDSSHNAIYKKFPEIASNPKLMNTFHNFIKKHYIDHIDDVTNASEVDKNKILGNYEYQYLKLMNQSIKAGIFNHQFSFDNSVIIAGKGHIDTTSIQFNENHLNATFSSNHGDKMQGNIDGKFGENTLKAGYDISEDSKKFDASGKYNGHEGTINFEKDKNKTSGSISYKKDDNNYGASFINTADALNVKAFYETGSTNIHADYMDSKDSSSLNIDAEHTIEIASLLKKFKRPNTLPIERQHGVMPLFINELMNEAQKSYNKSFENMGSITASGSMGYNEDKIKEMITFNASFKSLSATIPFFGTKTINPNISGKFTMKIPQPQTLEDRLFDFNNPF